MRVTAPATAYAIADCAHAPCLPRATTVVAIARTWLGTPYHHQASLKGVGTDCLGLVRGVWRELYGPEPKRSPPYTPRLGRGATARETLLEAARRHLIEVAPAEAQPGDVLLFRWRAAARQARGDPLAPAPP